MNCNLFRAGVWWLTFAALCAAQVKLAPAGNPPLVTGSYQILQSAGADSLAQIQMRILLVNHGASDLAIQRITLRDFSQPERGTTRACAVALHAHASAETTQEFAIQRSEYELWQKGVRPRLVLQIEGPGGAKGKTVVRLDRLSEPEAK